MLCSTIVTPVCMHYKWGFGCYCGMLVGVRESVPITQGAGGSRESNGPKNGGGQSSTGGS